MSNLNLFILTGHPGGDPDGKQTDMDVAVHVTAMTVWQPTV
jgi:hypothetical protein